jgi:hypothetical protein
MTTRHSLRLLAASFGLLVSSILHAQSTPPTGPQQLVFAGLRSSSVSGQFYAQFNAVQADSSGNLYLLLDQRDGVRLLKTDPSATTILSQAQIGARGDIGLAMALDPAGNVYITGTTTSGSLAATSGVTFPNPADTSTNSFIGKFDANLNPIFVTFAGSGHMAAAAIAATADAVFITGSIFSATLPVTPAGIIQSPAIGSTQNGFVEKFNSAGTILLYATYLGGINGNTAPAAVVADSSGNAYIAGYTTSTGYPTISALIPESLSSASGFLTKLTPAGDGVVFSTFIPGDGITSLAIDPNTQNLLLSGTISLGQFPIATVTAPLVDTAYQSLVRLPLDGSTVLGSILLAPGAQSSLAPDSSGNVWIAGTLNNPLTASLLPIAPLSTTGNSYALRVTSQSNIDQAVRFGGLPTSNSAFASIPVNLTSVATDPTGQPVFAGSASPTASSSLLATETYDLALYNAPSAVLPSTLRDTVLPTGSCSGSLCSGSAAFLAKLNPLAAAPSPAIAADNAPNITLRNLGTLEASNLQVTATNFTVATDCPTSFFPGSKCTIALSGSGPGTLTVQAANATTQTVQIPASTNPLNPLAISPSELDFGIQTSTSPASNRTVTITNLSSQPQTFTSALQGTVQPYTLSEQSSDCPASGPLTNKFLAPGSTCHITLSLAASSSFTDDGFVQANWTIGTQSVLLSGYAQAAGLSLSASEIDFGTQYVGAARLPRYLYLSNNSASAISHASVALPPPFALIDLCPTTLEPHTVCQLQLTYNQTQFPSADSTTLALDQNLSVLVTGSTRPQPIGTGQSVNPNLAVTPASVSFPNAVTVTSSSSSAQTVTIANNGTQPFPLALALTGDFSSTTNCVATLPGNSACIVVLTFSPSQPGTRQGILSVTAGSGAAPVYVSLSGTATPILPSNNGILDFGGVIIGQPSVQWYKLSQPFTILTAAITDPSFKAILVEDIGYGHGQPATSAFANTVTGTCANCWLGVQFFPSATGPQSATLTLTSSTTGNPYPITLTGSGLPLTGLTLTPTTQDFGPVPVASSSATALFTLTNLTSSAVTLTSPSVTGDFSLSNAPSGGPACTGTLSPTASCFLQIIFAPTTTGPRAGTLTLQTSATTLTASVTGFGSPNPGLSLNPNALVFSNVPGSTSTQQTITLANTGNSPLQIATPTTTTTSFTPSTTCTTLFPGSTCTIAVAFTPATSFLSDTLQILVTTTTGSATTYTVPLSSTYTSEDAGLQILPAQSNFGPNATETFGLTRQFTINNLTAKSLTLDLDLPRQFVLTSPPCAGLAPNASCNFSVAFLPLTNGDITGTLFAQATPTDGSATLNGLAYVEGYGNGSGALSITGNLINTGGTGDLLPFGQVGSGQSSTQTLTLSNNNAASITIRRITSEWPFLVTATTCGTTLSSHQSCTVTIAYTPLNQVASSSPSSLPGDDAGTLVIESDALTSPDLVDLTGSSAPIAVASPDNSAPLISFVTSQSSLTFASTAVGNASAPQTVTLINTGTTTIHIASLKATSDFIIASNCTAIVPGSSCSLTVTFTPQGSAAQIAADRIGSLEIASDASTALEFISLFGTATPSTLNFTPGSLDFGTVLIGSTSRLPLVIANNGPNAATFKGISATGDYAATGDCPAPGASLQPSASCTLQIAFTPSQTGTRTGTLSVASSVSTLPLTAPLTGIGSQSHLQLSPVNLNFGNIAIGAVARLTLTLSNTGTATLTNVSLAVTGDYAVIVPCGYTILTPGSSCTVTVAFTPTALGARPGTLTITSSSPDSPSILPLTGTGVPNGTFILSVNGGTSASATTPSGKPATYALALTPQNSFNGTVVLNCTPVTPGQYATCSLLPSSIALASAPQNSTATINTLTSVNLNQKASVSNDRSGTLLLCLLPAAFLFLWRPRHPRSILSIFWIALFSATTLLLTACGSGGDPSLRYTPPGVYKYQITASSTTGAQYTQSVTLNLTVTAE